MGTQKNEKELKNGYCILSSFPCSSMVEHLAVNERVAGSSPAGGAISYINTLLQQCPNPYHTTMASYESLLRSFAEKDLRYLIVGGVAVNLHGYPRFTNDIDILLALDHENLKKMAEIMEDLGYQQRLPISLEELGDEQRVRALMEEKELTAYSFIHAEEPQFNVDVIVAESLDFEKFSAQKMHATVWNIDVPVVSIDDLIGMKQRSDREKDVQDVVALLELKGL